MKKIQDIFKTYFGTGLLVIIPLLVTAWLIRRIVVWVDEIFSVNQWSPIVVPGLGLVLAIMVILLAGVIGRNVIGSWLVANLSELLKKIPLIGSVYGGLRQALQAIFNTSGEKKFGKAVLVRYPHADSWTIGLVTSDKSPPDVSAAAEEELMSVFVPTTPNPTSGFLIFVRAKDTRPLNMKVDDALKTIVSLGLVEGTSQASRKYLGQKGV